MSSERRTQIVLGAILGAGILAAAILYWPALRLPLIYDDLLHIRITKSLDFFSVWLPTDDFGFYRPLTFLPLLIVKSIFNGYPPELLHGMNVLQHAVNSGLLIALSWRLWRKAHWALAAGLLFVIFPFSYQAVAVYGHNVHPAVTGLILAGLHTYLSAIRAQKHAKLWWSATAALFILSLLSHESAILFGLLAATMHWNEEGVLPIAGQKRPGAILRQITIQPWFLFLAAGFIYAVGYQFLSLSRAPQATFGENTLWYKFLYLGQGAAFPVAWFGRWLPEVEPVSVFLVLAGLVLMALLTDWSGRDVQNRLPLLMGWVWWGAAALLVALPLETDYFLHGPRLLYLSSAGLAILWPVLLEPIFKVPRNGPLVWSAILLFIVVSNWIYVRERLSDYTELTAVVDLVTEYMNDQPEGEGVALINLPQWLDDLENTYHVGVDLAAMLGDYLFVEELVGENLGVNRPARAFRAPDLLAVFPDYRYGIHEESGGDNLIGDWAPQGSHVFITTYAEDGLTARYAGAVFPADETAAPLATIGPYDLLGVSAQDCSGIVKIESAWRISSSSGGEKPPLTTSLFVQYIDNNGQLVNQFDGPLLTLRPDLLNLDDSWQVADRREIGNPDGKQGQVLIGVYDYASGERYSVDDGSGSTKDGLI
ncbi:MAG: hypothetical protein ACK2T3_15770, partial [Candidatus Promineifilaceae bacterium]